MSIRQTALSEGLGEASLAVSTKSYKSTTLMKVRGRTKWIRFRFYAAIISPLSHLTQYGMNDALYITALYTSPETQQASTS